MEIVSILCNTLPESAKGTYRYFNHENEAVRRNRAQACELFPMLAGVISGAILASHNGWDHKEHYGPSVRNLKDKFYLLSKYIDSTLVKIEEVRLIQNAVDLGTPLIPELSRVLNIRRSLLKHLVRERAHLVNRRWLTDPKPLLYLLDCTAPEKWPRGAKEWQLLEDFSFMLRRRPKWLHDIMKLGLSASESKMRKLCSRLPICNAIKDVEDVINSINRFRTQKRRNGKSPELWNLSVFKALFYSQKWHEQVRKEFASSIANTSQHQGLTWPSIIEEPLVIRGITIIPLNSERALQEEGVMQNHCVSTYVMECLEGRSHIFSLRSVEDGILSTLELSIDIFGNSVEIAVVQHRGNDNTIASQREQCVEKEFISYLQLLPSSKYAEFDAALCVIKEQSEYANEHSTWYSSVEERKDGAEFSALIKTFGVDRLLQWGIDIEKSSQV